MAYGLKVSSCDPLTIVKCYVGGMFQIKVNMLQKESPQLQGKYL